MTYESSEVAVEGFKRQIDLLLAVVVTQGAVGLVKLIYDAAIVAEAVASPGVERGAILRRVADQFDDDDAPVIEMVRERARQAGLIQ